MEVERNHPGSSPPALVGRADFPNTRFSKPREAGPRMLGSADSKIGSGFALIADSKSFVYQIRLSRTAKAWAAAGSPLKLADRVVAKICDPNVGPVEGHSEWMGAGGEGFELNAVAGA